MASVDSALYTGVNDLPYYNVEINETDTQNYGMIAVGATIANIHVTSYANNTLLVAPHAWGANGLNPATGIQMDGWGSIFYPRLDGTTVASIAINTSHVYVYGGTTLTPSPSANAVTLASGVSSVTVTGYDCYALNATNCVVQKGTAGTNINVFGNMQSNDTSILGKLLPGASSVEFGTGAGARSTGANSTFVGQYAGSNVGQGVANTVIGMAAMNNGASLVTSGGWTAVGQNAFNKAQGNSAAGAAFGSNACSSVTSGATDVCIGNNVGSTTLQSGSNDILIGNSSATDAATAGASNEINIGGLIFYNQNSLAAPALSACGTSPTIDAHANNKSGAITIGGGTVTSCTATFAGTGYASWNHCRVTPHSTLAGFGYSDTLTGLTITGTALAGAVVDYDCDGY